jgi:hypothetical protein
MKEVFTKSFWEGVKKTFDDAREGPPTTDDALQTKTEMRRHPGTTHFLIT